MLMGGEEKLDSWAQLETRLRELKEERAKMMSTSRSAVPRFLYRGHASSAWKLQTTLERYTKDVATWSDYASLAGATVPAVETLTKQRWHFPEEELQRWASNASDVSLRSQAPPGYDYLLYLRHHGFPSPLLDWSESPFVAAFFAFAPVGNQDRSIHVLLETTGNGKLGMKHWPNIMSLGAYVTTHPRHVLQQAVYTICYVNEDGERHIADHEEGFARQLGQQDLLWKFTLPASERIAVLRHLDSYNLNAYSLFQTEDKLLETIALREIDFRED